LLLKQTAVTNLRQVPKCHFPAAMAGISAAWSRVTGRGAAGKKTLPADLKRITHSEVLDIPKELLTPVIEASVNEEDRPEIMNHLRECLCEPAGKNWRRVYAGLVLAEALVKNGSPDLLSETAEGRHFDLVQRLSFLEHFDNTDKRVMNNIRKKAEALRKEVVPILQGAAVREIDDSKDTASTCSPVPSTVTGSTAVSSTATASGPDSSRTGFGSDDFNDDNPMFAPEAPKGIMILNGIVSVGHSDDTTSESEGGEDKARMSGSVHYREPKKMTAKARNERSRRGQGHSSDSDEAPQSKPAAAAAAAAASEPSGWAGYSAQAPAPAQTVDLLDL